MSDKYEKKPIMAESLGNAGEIHQINSNEQQKLTTNHGLPISDNQNSLRMGERGPTLLEDFVLREKIFHFDHERIPERIVHARGSGAHGYFECTEAIPELTKASLFQKKGNRVPVFTRFSTVAGSKGSKDTPRDVRGFAVKFYTEEGNWDLVGNNMPVFFIQDAMKFPDLVHSVKPEADRMFPQAASAHDTFWDFISLMPESMHMIMWAMSDFALPRSLRMMDGFGVHTFRFTNAKNKSTFVKFHWRPKLGVQATCWDEAVKISGADSDYHRRDLWEAIQKGDFPEWDFAIQTFDEEWALKQPYDVLDATKLIPEEEIPLKVIGKMVLNRNPDNFFAETEQAAFLPSNIVAGIDFSDDPLLQGRLFSYMDTQKSRLGTTNFHQIPINAPKCPFANFQRDGMMQTMIPKGRANYEPNSLDEVGENGGPREIPAEGFTSFQLNSASNNAFQKLRIRAESFADHYSQAVLFYRSQTPVEQSHIASALIFELSKVTLEHVQIRFVSRLRNVDEELAKRVADELSITLPEKSTMAKHVIDMPISDQLSLLKKFKPTLKGRKVGILFSEGSDIEIINNLTELIKKSGGSFMLIAPKIGSIKMKDNKRLKAEGQLAGTPSVLFDAIALVLNLKAAENLSKDNSAIDFVRDAFRHLKAIRMDDNALPLIKKANITKDAGITEIDAEFIKAAARRFFDREHA